MRKVKITWVWLNPPCGKDSEIALVSDTTDFKSRDFEVRWKRHLCEPVDIISIQEVK